MCIEFTQARRNNVEVCLNWVYQHLRMLWNTFFSLAMRNSQFASKKKKVKKKRKRLWNDRQQSWYPLARSKKMSKEYWNTQLSLFHSLGFQVLADPPGDRISDLKIFCISRNRMGTLPWANPSCKSAFDATEWVRSAANAVNPAFLATMGLIRVWNGGRWRRQE
jgi:hypothetical protein